MITKAVVMSEPGSLSIQPVDLKSPSKEDIVIDINYSGISTGTEKLFYNGKMPQFPGMGYPLVPGYESTGEVVQAPKDSNLKIGDMVFVPGADCYSGSVKSLFGGAARMIISAPNRLIKINYSGISTGTEKLFYNGKMPQFPGMGYPLVPGYESTGEVVQAPKAVSYTHLTLPTICSV